MLGSSVRVLGHDSKTGARGAKRARVRAKKGSRAFRRRVHSLRVLRRLGIVRGALVTVQ